MFCVLCGVMDRETNHDTNAIQIDEFVDLFDEDNYSNQDKEADFFFLSSGRKYLKRLLDFVWIPDILKKTASHLVLLSVILLLVIIMIKQVKEKPAPTFNSTIHYIKNRGPDPDTLKHPDDIELQNSSECIRKALKIFLWQLSIVL